MIVDDGKQAVFATTGGRPHETGQPWLIFLHGAGGNHLVWVLQSRALAYDGYNVLAPDLPGHYRSGGQPPQTVEAMAGWLVELMDRVDCPQAVLCGHSMGGLIALETAILAPGRIQGIAFVATAAEIPVNARLISQADSDEFAAMESMMSWAHGPRAHLHDFSWPGGNQIRYAVDMMRLNRPGALAADLRACNEYSSGMVAAAKIECPTLCVLASQDRMTPASAGRKLAANLHDNRLVVAPDCGHSIPSEQPQFLNANLRRFLNEHIREAA